MRPRPIVFVVIDGFSFGDPKHICNAYELATTPTFDRLRKECPVAMLECGGERSDYPRGRSGTPRSAT